MGRMGDVDERRCPMAGRKAKPIELSELVCETLEKLVARHTTGQQKAQRARIILKAAEGKNNTEIANYLSTMAPMMVSTNKSNGRTSSRILVKKNTPTRS